MSRFSQVNNKDYNLIINSEKNQPSLNTPPFLDLYNIENDNKKSIFNWDINLLPSNVQTGTSAELQPAMTTAENEVQSTTTIENLFFQPWPRVEDILTEFPTQESSASQQTITTLTDNEIYEPEPEPGVEEFLMRGMEHENNMDPVAGQTSDWETSAIIELSTMADDPAEGYENQEEENTSSINNLVLPIPSSSHERSKSTLANTGLGPSADVILYGYFRHSIASKIRIRYQNELANNTMSSQMSHLKDCFLERPILLGPDTLVANGSIEISLLSTPPDNDIIYSPHTFYSSNKSGAEKFSNPIYLQADQLDIENGYIKLNLTIAKTRQEDFSSEDKSVKQYRWKRTLECKIKHYPSGEEELVNMTPRQLNKNYHLDTMFIGIRQVQLQPDGVTYRVVPNSPVIYSNHFIGVDADDSPKTWDFNEHKLKIMEMKIIHEGVSTNTQNDRCTIIFVIEIPKIFHCTLRSGCKQLEVKLMTNKDLSQIYKMNVDNINQNPIYTAVNDDIITLRLTIVKETLRNHGQIQNNVWLEPLLDKVNSAGFDHFHVGFCLQDVETNGVTFRRSYSHSSVDSVEFIDLNGTSDILPASYPENNIDYVDIFSDDDAILREVIGKRRNEDDGNIAKTLPVRKTLKINK